MRCDGEAIKCGWARSHILIYQHIIIQSYYYVLSCIYHLPLSVNRVSLWDFLPTMNRFDLVVWHRDRRSNKLIIYLFDVTLYLVPLFFLLFFIFCLFISTAVGRSNTWLVWFRSQHASCWCKSDWIGFRHSFERLSLPSIYCAIVLLDSRNDCFSCEIVRMISWLLIAGDKVNRTNEKNHGPEKKSICIAPNGSRFLLCCIEMIQCLANCISVHGYEYGSA